MPRVFSKTAWLVLLAVAVSWTPSLEAQYFGRNKVQYETFDFEVIKTEHFDVYYYPEELEAARMAGRMAERWYARLSLILEHELSGRQPLIVYASHPHFVQTNAIPGDLGEGTGGVTEIFKRRVVLPFAGPLKETDHVLGHELVHAFQFDITGSGKPGVTSGIPGAVRLPLWFIEGMAEFLSLGPEDAHTAMWMRDATRTHLPTLQELGSYQFFPYRYGQALWSYLAGRYGDEVVGRVLKATRTAGDAFQALYRVIGPAVNTLSEQWHATIREAYTDSVIEARQIPVGRELLSESRTGGRLNIAPELSPDGTKLIYLSEKDLFSIDMFLADARTGKTIRKITKTASDPHFESLQFINSAGAWAPDNRRFVFGAITEGQPVLTIVDTEKGKKLRELKFDDLGEVFNPTWSPDGKYIVFTGMYGGLTNLYMYDLELDQLSQLTNDSFAEIHPAWSPDGGQIAFSTDRFTSDVDRLQFGNYRLAVMDFETRRIEELPTFAEGKSINPQWAPDGRSVYFISDRDGVSNIYRLDLAELEVNQVTDVFTGISGITSISPAVSSAHDADAIAYSIYEGGRYDVFVVDTARVLAGGPLSDSNARTNMAILPPEDRVTDDLAILLDDYDSGLADDQGFQEEDYHPGLSLDYVAQPYLVAGSDRFGTFVGGGAALFWSDMLGNHNLATALQVNGSFKDIQALVGYENRAHRWNWGGVVQQVPYVIGGVSQGVVQQDGQNQFVEQLVKFRQINRDVIGTLSYAFNRSRRVEFQGGFRNITFEQETKTRFFNADGSFLNEVSQDTTFDSFNLGQFTAALVYDNSIFGATGPLMGQRYRIEATPIMGSLNYVNVLGDFRRYVMVKKPYTLAWRVLHFGRYGTDSENDRLTPLFLGYPNLIRGYDDGTFNGREECNQDGCPIFERLFGTKLAVANFELRFPIWAALGGSGFYGFLPVDFIAFADAGIAWSENDSRTPGVNEQAFFFGGDRKPVYSAGGGVRINTLGFAIFQITLARAFNRIKFNPDGSTTKGRWVWQFALTPGF